MDFNAFLDLLPKIRNAKLPGFEAHAKMQPLERVEIMRNLDLETANPRQAAVMMLLYPVDQKTHFVLIVRNSYPGVHSDQIAFPGGKTEAFDGSYEATALRETFEEVGVPSAKITVVRPFSQLYIPPSNFMVFPFLGYCRETPEFFPDPAEVAGIISFSVSDFLDENTAIVQKMATSYMASINVPGFLVEGKIVWGATAMMLSELKEVLKSALLQG